MLDQACSRPDLDDVIGQIDRALQITDTSDQIVALSKIKLNIRASAFAGIDPFSDVYRRQVLALYNNISGNEHYRPEIQEMTNALDDFDVSSMPIPYRYRDSAMVGEVLACYGWILRNLDVRAGHSVLEYGPGEGQLILHLARMGCDAYAVDIEPRFLTAIQKQCAVLGAKIETKVGKFGDGVGTTVDRVLFFEAFHHCFDHEMALKKIRGHLNTGGYICFSGEPIIPASSINKPMVPYPWGPRLDGESVRSIHEFGWMELGYSRSYFVELCMRCGYSVRFIPCPFFERGDVYIARPIEIEFPILDDVLLESWSGKSGWYPSEMTHRWTTGDAVVPLPQTGLSRAEIGVVNLAPRDVHLILRAGGNSMSRILKKEVSETISVSVQGARYLEIQSLPFISPDGRDLGVAVTAIRFFSDH
jgi:2-polyprenyl-3-methyl-5-hydroxy-6-metoxy-1,4-benzoquinol methylase